MREVAADANALRQSLARRPCRARLGIAESEAFVDEVADRLHASPPAADGAKVRPPEIGQKVRLAIPAGQKKRQRLARQIGRGDKFSGLVGVIFPTLATKDAVKPQRQAASGRRQASYHVSATIDKAIGCDGWGQSKIRLLGNAVAGIRVDIHHGQNGRRLCELERNIETVANLHMELPPNASRPPNSRNSQ